MEARIEPDLATLDRVAGATRELGRFSGSASGVGEVLGGMLGLAAYLAYGFGPLNFGERIGLAAFPFVWIAAKEGLRKWYYQRMGRVSEEVPVLERWVHGVRAGVVAAVCAGVLMMVVPRAQTVELWTACVITLATPVLVWRYLRTSSEFIVGLFLLCQAAMGMAGGRHAPPSAAVPLVSAGMIVFGMLEHWRYVRACRVLAEVRGEGVAG